MAVLVSGGAGFIGSQLCRELLKQGLKVVAYDHNLKPKKKRIADLIKNRNFRIVERDITDAINYRGEKISQIFHLASPTSQKDYALNPQGVLWANAAGTKNLLELAKKHHAKFLFTSSAEIYGTDLNYPQQENDYGKTNPVGLRSCYTEGKRFAESLCMAYHRSFGVPVKILRLFNIYGPGMSMNDGRSIQEFITHALNNRDVILHNGGVQTRTFCFITDAVMAMMAAMETGDDCTGPLNIGSIEEISIHDLAKKIIRLTGSRSKIVAEGKRNDDPDKRKPDISLAKKLIGFEPKVKLDDGLKLCIEYFQLFI